MANLHIDAGLNQLNPIKAYILNTDNYIDYNEDSDFNHSNNINEADIIDSLHVEIIYNCSKRTQKRKCDHL